MKRYFGVFILVLILAPIMILGYQNCAELGSKSLEANNNSLNQKVYSPYFVNDLTLLDYDTESCPFGEILSEPLLLYHPDYNLCTNAQVTCEAEYLIRKGFSEDDNVLCDQIPDVEDNSIPYEFSYIDPETIGFVRNPDQVCTAVYKLMISFDNRTCAEATDGCKYTFLKNKNYIDDNYNNCSSKL